VPDHPLVSQAIRDCLEEAMDLPQLDAILQRVLTAELRLVARDTTEPSPLASEIVNARVYQFLDDAPLEERRTHAVYTRRALEPSSSNDLAALDSSAIERVRDEAWPTADDEHELHDALLTAGFILEVEALERGTAPWPALFQRLIDERRATRVRRGRHTVWITAERLSELGAVLQEMTVDPPVDPPRGVRAEWTAEEALVELVRSRMDVFGPATQQEIAGWLESGSADTKTSQAVELALLALENEGRLLRGHFTPGGAALEWCDRRLLARIHRYTLDRLRAEIEPVSPRDFLRFLFRWQRVEPEQRMRGPDALAAIIEQCAGFEAAAAAWEADILPLRVHSYEPALLDTLCLSGRVVWGRLGARGNGSGAAPVRATPLALVPREAYGIWNADRQEPAALSSNARVVHDVLGERGASFFHDLVAACGLLPTQVEAALAELVAAGIATADSFTGLRALLVPEHKRAALSATTQRRRRSQAAAYSVANAGRWSLLRTDVHTTADDVIIEQRARALLHRYGVVFRRVLAREAGAPRWRELVVVYRRLEARGEIRGGRFVSGMAGEQFALPEAVGLLRAVRREQPSGATLVISAADPLNLVGIVTPETERVLASHRNRILFRDGAPVAAVEAGEIRLLSGHAGDPEDELRRALGRGTIAPHLRAYLRSDRSRERWRRRAAEGGVSATDAPPGRAGR
jgi:ATP-dependent Lhr-like helicase